MNANVPSCGTDHLVVGNPSRIKSWMSLPCTLVTEWLVLLPAPWNMELFNYLTINSLKYFWLNATLCVFSGTRNFWLEKVRWSNPQALSSPALLRWGEMGSSADNRDSGLFCWKWWCASVISPFLPRGGSTEQAPAFSRGGWTVDAGDRMILGSPSAWRTARRSVQAPAGTAPMLRGWMGLDESPVSGRTTESLTYYAIKFWKDCYMVLVSALHPNG